MGKSYGSVAATNIVFLPWIGMEGFDAYIAEKLDLRVPLWPVMHAPLITQLEPDPEKLPTISILNKEVDYFNHIILSFNCYQFTIGGELTMLGNLTVMQKVN